MDIDIYRSVLYSRDDIRCRCKNGMIAYIDEEYMDVRAKIVLVFIIIGSLFLPLYANRLMFETSTGTVTNFDVKENSNSDNPLVRTRDISNYGGSSEYWSLDGFVGRLVYEGEPNTITVENIGPNAIGGSNRFYYTRVRWFDGSSDPNVWREVFFTARVKGRMHNGGTYTGHNSNNNFLIESPGDSFTVPGAGAETANPGETAYNSNGDIGTYNTATGYIYKYPYRYIWVDFTAIRIRNDRNLSGVENQGYYESIIQLNGAGVQQVLSLEGFYDPYSVDISPNAFSFSIERLSPEFIPFEELKTKTSYNNSYLVGHVRFHYTDNTNPVNTTGTVGFYSDSAGLSTDFRFRATVAGTEVSFPYSVVFDPVICGNTSTASTVSSMNNSFTTEFGRVNSVIDSQFSDEIALTGDLRIFLASGLTSTSFPAANYSSVIYAFVTIN